MAITCKILYWENNATVEREFSMGDTVKPGDDVQILLFLLSNLYSSLFQALISAFISLSKLDALYLVISHHIAMLLLQLEFELLEQL